MSNQLKKKSTQRVSFRVVILAFFVAFNAMSVPELFDEDSDEQWQSERTLGIHFTVAGGQATTTINSGSVTLWCNGTCTNPQQNSTTLNGTGFPVGPGNFTYVCTTNGSQCFPAGNLQTVCGGTGSVRITNNYANAATYTSACLPVSLSSNTMVTSAGVQTMTTQ